AEDIAVRLPPVADRLLDDLCEAARHFTEESMTGIDQIARRVAGGLLRSQGARADAQKDKDQGQGPQDCAHRVLHRVFDPFACLTVRVLVARPNFGVASAADLKLPAESAATRFGNF